MKNFFLGAAVAFLACDGVWHLRQLFWIEYFQFSLPVAGDPYSPTLGTVELVLAGALLLVCIVVFLRRRSQSRSVSYPPRRFAAPLS